MTEKNKRKDEGFVDAAGNIIGKTASELPGEIAGEAAKAFGGVVVGQVVKNAVNGVVETVGEGIVGAVDNSGVQSRTITAAKPVRSRRFKRVVGAISSVLVSGLCWYGISAYNKFSERKTEAAQSAIETEQAIQRLESEIKDVIFIREFVPKLYAATLEKPLLFDYNELPDAVSSCSIRGREVDGKKYLGIECNVRDVTSKGWRLVDRVVGGVDRDLSATIIEDAGLNGLDKNDYVTTILYENDDRDDAVEKEKKHLSELSDGVQQEVRQRYFLLLKRAAEIIR